MKIALSDIKGMERRVRKSQSPEKLEELADSLKEMGGVIVPIKVRKNGNGYTLVYGHRRVAAAKMAGLKDIEAIVENVPEDKLLTQALVENVVREDMAAIDIAKALSGIIEETGCTHEALAAKLGWVRPTVTNYLEMLNPELGLNGSAKGSARNLSVSQVEEAKRVGDNRLAARVLQKTVEGIDGETLSTRQTRQVAEVVRKAAEFGGEKAVKKVLAQPAAQILAEAPAIRHPGPKPTVRKVEGKIVFSWIKQSRTILAEEGMNIARGLIVEIARDDRDPAGGKAVIRRLVSLAKAVVREGEKALTRM